MSINDSRLDRRELMKLGLFGSAALALPLERVARTQAALGNRIAQSELPQPFTIPFRTPPVLRPERQTQSFDYYAITQRQASVEILPGKRTDIWGYNGITPGPTIVNRQGRHAVVQHVNDLPAIHPTLRYNVWTSTHLHGSCSKPQYDGYASDITEVGSWKDYLYPNIQEARTLWYHDHGVHITGANAYMGLAAMYFLHDDYELSLPIPHGMYDVPFVLRDAMFESDGRLLFDDSDDSGVFGDVILVNGVPWPAMQVQRRKYRFRILNGSVSRSYDLSLDSGEPLIVIGTDGGLMPRAAPVSRLKSAPAERYEVVIDFSRYQVGQRVVMHNDSPPNNIDYETTSNVMAFDVVAEAGDARNNEVPFDLNPHEPTMALKESDAVRTRKFEFERKNGQWTINGRTWDDVVNSDFREVLADPGFGDVEIWELQNPHGGWFHPVHAHLVDFKILDRNGRPPFAYERGPKDVVYVGENEIVRVLMRFEHEQGRYMIHCHNLVHEDHDMMHQFRVGSQSGDPDPIKADPPARKPARPLRNRRDDPEDQSSPGSVDADRGGARGDSGFDDDGRAAGRGGDDDRAAASTSSSVPQPKPKSCAPKATKAVAKKKTKKTKLAGGRRRPARRSPAKKRATCATPPRRSPSSKRRRPARRKPARKRR